MKKTFIISAVLLFFVLIFLGIYNLVFRSDSAVPVQPKMPALAITEKMGLEKKKIQAVSEQGIIGAAFGRQDESIFYYSAEDGICWKADTDGEAKEKISAEKLEGLKNVIWSPDRAKVLTEFERDGKTIFYEYDYQSQKGTKLKENLDSVAWDNLGAKIFYKYYDSKAGKRSLNVSNPDGSDWKKIADVEYRNVSIAAIPLTAYVSFWNSPDADEETKFAAVGVSGGEPKTILGGRFGADYLWSPDGSKALASSLTSRAGKTFSLGLVTFSGEYTDLGIPTIAKKCVWSKDGKNIYYALPGGIPETALMPDDYQENKFFTEDTFWKIDTSNGKKERIVEAADIGGKLDSTDLFLSAAEDALYFTNRIDRKLYKIEL